MQVSVIIPVYNAANYLERAVSSAIEQKEVSEVILIEDYSTDQSLLVARKLEKKYSQVRIAQHSSNQNRGAGASRNLGIQLAGCPYIAFLDADDYYLPNRFTNAGAIFENHLEVDAVVESTLISYDDLKDKQRYESLFGVHDAITIEEQYVGRPLFEILVAISGNYIHLNGLTVRREKIIDRLLFDEQLRHMQDTDFLWRLSLHTYVIPGTISRPVATRRIHPNNRIFDNHSVTKNRKIFSKKWFDLMLTANWKSSVNRAIVKRYLDSKVIRKQLRKGSLRIPLKLVLLFYLFLRFPCLVRKLV